VAQIVECVPNFSEGRRGQVIDALADAIAHTRGVRLLDVQSDESHNRCVISFVGDLDGVVRSLRRRGVKVGRIRNEPFGRVTAFRDPEGNEIGLEEPPR